MATPKVSLKVTNRQSNVLAAVSVLDDKKGEATIANIAKALKVTTGPVFNHLTDLKNKGMLNNRSAGGKVVPGSWHLTPKGAKALAADNGARKNAPKESARQEAAE